MKNFRKTQFIRIFSGSITKILCCRWIDLEVTLQAWKVHIDGGGINYRDATCWPQDFFFFFGFSSYATSSSAHILNIQQQRCLP